MSGDIPRNRLDKQALQRRLDLEPFERRTVSFYRYVAIENPAAFRDALFIKWSAMNVLGRIYVAKEGINAQISVPEPLWEHFVSDTHSDPRFAGIPFKIGVTEEGVSFLKLSIKVKNRIVADGLEDSEIDLQKIGTHISAKEMNSALNSDDAIVIDMRNHYEYEVGHFDGAVCPNTETFRDALPKAIDMAKDYKEKEVVLYCTGGIRCEKASSYFLKHGFENVKQLEGGIIDYAHQINEAPIDNKYKGKNFVFDGRIAERISDQIISSCHQCSAPSDVHVNCHNDACHLLFIQCESCKEAHGVHCSPECKAFNKLSKEKQRALRKTGKRIDKALNVYHRHEKRDLMNQAW